MLKTKKAGARHMENTRFPICLVPASVKLLKCLKGVVNTGRYIVTKRTSHFFLFFCFFYFFGEPNNIRVLFWFFLKLYRCNYIDIENI